MGNSTFIPATDRRGCASLLGTFALNVAVQTLPVTLLLALSAGASPAPFHPKKATSDRAELQKAELLLKNHKYQKALKALRRVNSRRGKKCAACYWGMARVYWAMDDFDNTRRSCALVLRYASAATDREKALVYNLKGLLIAV